MLICFSYSIIIIGRTIVPVLFLNIFTEKNLPGVLSVKGIKFHNVLIHLIMSDHLCCLVCLLTVPLQHDNLKIFLPYMKQQQNSIIITHTLKNTALCEKRSSTTEEILKRNNEINKKKKIIKLF